MYKILETRDFRKDFNSLPNQIQEIFKKKFCKLKENRSIEDIKAGRIQEFDFSRYE